jgi:hypothetical protein
MWLAPSDIGVLTQSHNVTVLMMSSITITPITGNQGLVPKTEPRIFVMIRFAADVVHHVVERPGMG